MLPPVGAFFAPSLVDHPSGWNTVLLVVLGIVFVADDTSTSRETAFAKIRARVEGTQLASKELGIA